jgi:prepilin-type processing-associated H-X9-DG protein
VLAHDRVSVLCPAQGRRSPGLQTLADLRDLYERPDRCAYYAATSEMSGSYAYTLGYWQGTFLCGLRRDRDGLLPLMADRPSETGGNSLNHGGGQNILFVDGHVCWRTSTHVGPGGDDIFRNQRNQLFAGVDFTDVVLGPSSACPLPPD